MNNTNKVKTYFEESEHYLSNNTNLELRKYIISQMTKEIDIDSVLDLGCGDGSIAALFDKNSSRIDLVDISEAMLAVASAISWKGEIHLNRCNASQYSPSGTYDLILSIGILAHIDSIDRLLEVISVASSKGTNLIVQVSDSEKILTRIQILYASIAGVFGTRKYKLNSVRLSEVADELASRGFVEIDRYSYVSSIPIIAKIISKKMKRKFISRVFGDLINNKRSRWGNDCIVLYRKSL